MLIAKRKKLVEDFCKYLDIDFACRINKASPTHLTLDLANPNSEVAKYACQILDRRNVALQYFTEKTVVGVLVKIMMDESSENVHRIASAKLLLNREEKDNPDKFDMLIDAIRGVDRGGSDA